MGSFMEFGKYTNELIGNVPIDYLVWLDSQPDFRRMLNQYLRSDVGQARQNEEG